MKTFVQSFAVFTGLLLCLLEAQPHGRVDSRGLFWSGSDSDGEGSTGIGLGTAWGQAVEGLARQPEAAEEITSSAIVGSLFMVTPDKMVDLFFSNDDSERIELVRAIKSFSEELLGFDNEMQ